jgi:hypothetical protein
LNLIIIVYVWLICQWADHVGRINQIKIYVQSIPWNLFSLPFSKVIMLVLSRFSTGDFSPVEHVSSIQETINFIPSTTKKVK